MKPLFEHLPSVVQERLLWEMELDFDHYESSQAECVHDILNGNVRDQNERIIANAYKFLSEESLLVMLKQELEAAVNLENNLVALIKEVQTP